MFDCSHPILVRVATTYHPSGAWSGYIYALYEPLAYEPRELFFCNTRDALNFAAAKG